MVQGHPILRTAGMRGPPGGGLRAPQETSYPMDPAVRIQHSRKDKKMIPTILACLFAGAWMHSLYIQNKQRHEIARLRFKLWTNGLEA